jgi:RimJ/RimL family protein N-acetyltransferase
MEIQTERLLLRRWRPSDLDPFAALNADPRVMEYLPSSLSRAQSDELAQRADFHLERHGYGLWAAEIPGVTPFAGFIGLSTPRYEAPFQPCTEIGWRLGAAHWGKGYATEGARAVLDHGFDVLQLGEIVSITTVGNIRSRRVMEKLGMTHDPADDFEHPLLPEGHPLRPHVLYRKRRQAAATASNPRR